MALYIGIDPGRDTGFAVWNSQTRQFVEVSTLRIHQATRRVEHYRTHGEVVVVFEDARRRGWIPRERNLSEYRGRLMGAGSVKRDSSIWQDFFDDTDITYLEVPPRKGLTKWDADTFRRVTGWQGRTSNHARDAALLVFGK